MTKFYYSAFASVAVLALNSATSVAQNVSDIGNINIVSQDNLAMGLMEIDDGVKARSSIIGKVKSRERIAVLAALNLAYALEQQPETSRLNNEPGAEVDIGSLVTRIDKALGEHGHLL